MDPIANTLEYYRHLQRMRDGARGRRCKVGGRAPYTMDSEQAYWLYEILAQIADDFGWAKVITEENEADPFQTHDCHVQDRHKLTHSGYGKACDPVVYYDKATAHWYVSNDEYATEVFFCPWCGEKMPTEGA